MKYMLLCTNCNNKAFTNGDIKDLKEVPVAALPKHANGKDKDCQQQIKKIKCPKCGYLFRIVKLTPEKKEETNA